MKPAEVTKPSDTEVRVQRSFDAAPDLVWRAYTEPELFTRWCGTPGWTMPVCEMDVRVGGAYRWVWQSDEDATRFGFHGEFQEAAPPRRLKHTEFYDSGDSEISMGDMDSKPAIVTVEFDAQGDHTLVTTTIAFATQADRDAAFETGMTDGMEMSYQRLDVVLTS